MSRLCVLLDSTFVAQIVVVLCSEPEAAIPVLGQETGGTSRYLKENLGIVVGQIGRDDDW